MHFEFLIEDKSGEEMLKILVPRMIDTQIHTFKIHSYKGIGAIPKNMKTTQDAAKRSLLNQLPKLLSGYGKSFQYDLENNAVILVCDLDNKNKEQFLKELNAVLESCEIQPKTSFCIAIEECEAWFLGDLSAVKKAYPKAKEQILKNYKNDSICGTWEVLADAVFSGGSAKLKKLGHIDEGTQKSVWAKAIAPFMNVENNKSPSFNFFKSEVEKYCR